MSNPIAILFWFTLIVMPHVVVAQQNSGELDSQQIQTDDFVLVVPADWSQLDDPKTILTLLSPVPAAGVTFRDNIRVKKYPLAGVSDLDKIRAAQENSVGALYEVIGSGILRNAEPRIAWLAIKDKQPEPGQKSLTKVDYMLIHQEHLFVLHAMCETELLNERQIDFDGIARSIRFSDMPSPNPPAAPKKTRPPNSSAFEQGKTVGKYTFFAMTAAVGVWLILRLNKYAKK